MLLVAVLSVSLFAACTESAPPVGGTEAGTGTQAQPPSGTTDAGATPAGGTGVSAPGVYPIVTEPFTMSIFQGMHPSVTDYIDNALTHWMEEQTGITIEWTLVPNVDRPQRLNLMLASGNVTDVIQGGIPTPLLIEYADQGVIVPITQYIWEEAVYYQRMLEAHPGVISLTTAPDGEIYAMQNVTLALGNQMPARMWVNTEWMEELGLDNPTTTDEFADMLRAFRDNAPVDNPTASIIPMMGNTNAWHARASVWVLNAFVQYHATGTVGEAEPWIVRDGIVSTAINTEEYREGLRFLNMLVREGLYDPASFTQDQGTWRQIFEHPDHPRIGALPSGGPTAFGSAGNEERRNMYMAIPPVVGPNGFRHIMNNPYQNFTIHQNTFVVTHTMSDPRIAVKWADLLYSPEGARRSRWGVPDVDHVPADPGATDQFGNPAEWRPVLPWGAEQNSHWHGENPSWENFARHGQPFLNPLAFPISNEVIAYTMYQQFALPGDHYLPPMMFTPEVGLRINEIRSMLDPFWEEQRDLFIVGILDLDTDWDNYINQLNAMGLQELLDIYQARLNELRAG